MPLWLNIISIIVGSGVISGIFSYFNNNRKHKRDDFTELIKVIKEDNETLREEKKEREQQLFSHTLRLAELERTIQSLQNKIVLFESSHFDLPLPMWLKSTEGTMLSVNHAYEEVFLEPRGYSMMDYIGRKDSAVWPEDISKAFHINDQRVLRTKTKWIGKENIIGPDGKTEEWVVLKYVRKSGNTAIGIGGIAFRKNEA
ncbi:PAS domain-containing protein [Owenweeksia hongkongensis DSM 17368]|uniref:PAS domain-containing protein n=1 Tax=Owenweeksia hongkongensis (strain DSM 17368 / CIP 108786 / JCM 12287 / NRRL B-23963 / UST20020801) TaxID=926562 RepID=G8R3R0_OWEHD|nr:PAS domain-containing protein [Owenweeksia hongkongensis]AEV34147.1 PAS domain-containing protein [Owenweeksia hongkongensis DSM 17368]